MLEMPVSTTATPTPSPRLPALHAVEAPDDLTKFDCVVNASKLYELNVALRSRVTALIEVERPRRSRVLVLTVAAKPSTIGSCAPTVPPAARTSAAAAAASPVDCTTTRT